MAKKKLTDQHMKEMTQMVSQGKTPEEISKHFNIAVSSVHNYKRELKKKGVEVPDIKGKRPGDPYKKKPAQVIAEHAPIQKRTTLKSQFLKLTINEIVFQVDSRARSVVIGQDELHVTF